MARDRAAERRRAAVQRAIAELGRDFTRGLLARVTGVHRTTVRSWLRTRGEAARAPNADSALQVARGLRRFAGEIAGIADRLEREIHKIEQEE